MATPLFLPTNNEWVFLLLHISQHLVSSASQSLVIRISVQCYLTVVLICISLMTFNAKHLFICSFSICISSLVRCLLRIFDPFFISSCLFSYCWVLEYFVCFNNSPLSDSSFEKTWFLACLLILLTLSITEHNFLILMKSSLSIKFSMDHDFGIVSKTLSPYPRSSRF